MSRIIRSTPLPAVAIGGIQESNLAEVLRAGAVNVAVVRAVCGHPDPAAAIRRLLEIWRAEVQPPPFRAPGSDPA